MTVSVMASGGKFLFAAPVSCTFEPVGRWFEAFITRRQHSSTSHLSTGSAGSSSESNEDENVSSDEEDDSFILLLDPKEWKVLLNQIIFGFFLGDITK